MSERPYHKAMSFDAAIGLLRQESGKALDPRVVQTFIDMYPDAGGGSRRQRRAGAQADARADARAGRGSRPSAWSTTPTSARTNVFEDIALAHREIYALYEIAQAMGSSLGVVGHDGADLVEAEQHRPVLVLRAVPLQRRNRDAALPLRDRRRGRSRSSS